MTELAEPLPAFRFEEHPDHPGWMNWTFIDDSRYNSFLDTIIVRSEGNTARVRMWPSRKHSNFGDNVHGGALLGFIDVALFAAIRSLGVIDAGPSVTLDLNTHFIGAGKIDMVLEAEVEMLRETRRLIFLRGLLVQETGTVAEFSGTIRKANVPRV